MFEDRWRIAYPLQKCKGNKQSLHLSSSRAHFCPAHATTWKSLRSGRVGKCLPAPSGTPVRCDNQTVRIFHLPEVMGWFALRRHQCFTAPFCVLANWDSLIFGRSSSGSITTLNFSESQETAVRMFYDVLKLNMSFSKTNWVPLLQSRKCPSPISAFITINSLLLLLIIAKGYMDCGQSALPKRAKPLCVI